jgi:2-(1,2-epoxy-1,2-dihydrophenyl)acetyl-CoA isomerase
MPDVLVDKQSDGVTLVTLNRPDSLNAMGGTLMAELSDALADCERDRNVRVVALTGAGRGFCAGGDMKGFAQRAGAGESAATPSDAPPAEAPSIPARLETGARGLASSQRATSHKLHTMLKPTVALVNGAAAGAGMSLALACDMRLMSDRAKLVPAFARIAFSGDYGGSYYLTKLVGFGRAREIYFTGEPITPERALELGIANRVIAHDDLIQEGLAYCARIASGPPGAFGRMKENFLRAELATVEEALDEEAFNMTLSGLTRDHREGVRAFVEKREPNFTGE